MKSNRLFVALGLLFIGLAILTAPARGDTLEQIKRKNQIRIAVYNDFPPFSQASRGIDVDIAQALAEKLGVKVDLVWFNADENMDDDLRNIIWKGHYLGGRMADIMMRVPVDPVLIGKNDKVKIFAPYHKEQLAVARNLTRIPAFAGMAGLEIFTKEKIGVEVATISDDFLTSALGGRLRDNVVHFKNVNQATTALKKGQVAAVMAPRSELEAGMGRGAENIVISPFQVRGLAVNGWDVGVAVKADNTDLAAAVEQAMQSLRKDGTIQRVFLDHGITYIDP